MTLVCTLDAGHGGASTGVVRGNEGPDRLVEKDYVLELALLLHDRLGSLPGVIAPLVRHEDKDLGLEEAAKIAAEYQPDFALCLHVNASKETSARGLMAFHHPEGDWKAKDAAAAIALHAPGEMRRLHPRATIATPLEWEAVRNVMAPYVKRQISCVLVECGFASNNADRAYLLSPTAKHALANAIEAGVIEFWRLSEKQAGSAA